MKHAEEVAILQRCIELARKGSTQLAAATGSADVSGYMDSQRYSLEAERIFRRLPQALAHVSQLEGRDTFLTTDSPWGSLLLTRDAQGEVRAFHNVCRHRGTRLVQTPHGCAQRFTCPYHAWTYSNQGALIGIPHGEICFPDLDRAEGLVPVDCVVRFGFIWIGANAAGLDHHLAGIEADLDWLALDSLKVFTEEYRVWQANWKLIAEGGLESYHFRHAHRTTIAPHFYDNLSLYHRFGSHFRSVLPKRQLTDLDNVPQANWKLRDHVHMTYALFPSTTLLVQQDHIVWIQAIPQAIDRTAVRILTLVPGANSAQGEQPASYWQKNHAITCATLDEDFAMAENIQVGLASGANRILRFGRNEGALTEFQQVVAASI